jgi:hypothetical protein
MLYRFVPGLIPIPFVIYRNRLPCDAVAINHKDGSPLEVVYNDPVHGQVYLTDVFANSKSWIEDRIDKLTTRWVDPGTGQVLPIQPLLAMRGLIWLHLP